MKSIWLFRNTPSILIGCLPWLAAFAIVGVAVAVAFGYCAWRGVW